MATFDRRCEQCAKAFQTSSRRARFCGSTCRGRAHRGVPPTLSAVPDSPAEALKQAGASQGYEKLAGQVRRSLEAANALDTVAGMTAIRVAQQIDEGGDAGTAIATLSKELTRLTAEAKLEAAPLNRDKADDIAAQVNAKLLRLVQ